MKTTEVVTSTPVSLNGKFGELKTFKQTLLTRFHGYDSVRYVTKLFIDGEYFMTVSCGNIKGNSKKAIANRVSLKNQYGIVVL